MPSPISPPMYKKLFQKKTLRTKFRTITSKAQPADNLANLADLNRIEKLDQLHKSVKNEINDPIIQQICDELQLEPTPTFANTRKLFSSFDKNPLYTSNVKNFFKFLFYMTNDNVNVYFPSSPLKKSCIQPLVQKYNLFFPSYADKSQLEKMVDPPPATWVGGGKRRRTRRKKRLATVTRIVYK